MTGHWLTLSAAARRLGVSIPEVLNLGDQGLIVVQFQHDIHSVSEESVTAYLSPSECPGRDADAVAEHADRTEWRGGPELPDFIEDEYQRGKDT
jgi:hypothetical protein